MEQYENKPPTWMMILLHCIVHPEFQEEIEGDLLEKYQDDLKKYGLKRARRRLCVELFSVIKPHLIFNINHSTMKLRIWLSLVLTALIIIIASVAPFLPGAANSFSLGISQFAQTIGYIGLPFMPFGLIWLIIELRNKKGQKLNRWTNGYYMAWLAMVPVFLLLLLQISTTIFRGQPFPLLPFAIIIPVMALIIYRIKKLKNKTGYKFNRVPFYIVLIPLTGLVTSKFAVEKAAAFSREKAIVKTEPLIAAIEKYKTEYGDYPDNLERLQGKFIQEIPRLTKNRIRPYQYEKRNGSYQLSFEQLWHWNATEVVVYNTSGPKDIKGNYESRAAEYPNWWHYMAD